MKSIIRDFWGKVHRREGTEARFKRLNHISEILLPFGVAGSGGGVGVGVPSGSTIKNPPAVQKMQETWVQSLGWEDPLEEGTATHSSVLAWRIPWLEKPGVLQPMGSQRVGHD